MKVLIVIENFPEEYESVAVNMEKSLKDRISRFASASIIFHKIKIAPSHQPTEMFFMIMGELEKAEINQIKKIISSCINEIFPHTDVIVVECGGMVL